MRFRCSSLDHGEVCPGYLVLQSPDRAPESSSRWAALKDTGATIRGTRIHAILERLMIDGRVEGYDAHEVAMCRAIIAKLPKFVRMSDPRMEVKLSGTVGLYGLSGHADVVCQPGGAHPFGAIVDWKSGTNARYPEITKHLQMVAYALLAFGCENPVTLIRAYPDRGTYDMGTVTPELLKDAELRISSACDKAIDDAPYRPGEACGGCLAKHQCPVIDECIIDVMRYLSEAYGASARAKVSYALCRTAISARLDLLNPDHGDNLESDGVRVRVESKPTYARVVKRPQGILQRLSAEYGSDKVRKAAGQILSRRPSLTDIDELVRALGGTQDDGARVIKEAVKWGDITREPGPPRRVVRIQGRG